MSVVPVARGASFIARGAAYAAERFANFRRVKQSLNATAKAVERVDNKVEKTEEKVTKKAGSAGVDRTGKVFTQKTKREIDAENAAQNGGVNRCTNCDTEVVPAPKTSARCDPTRKRAAQRSHQPEI
ncbi:hypothetical protein KDD30_15280 [Photobacterium sp. GJ3]|uniref:hypothetical protein n=1 Tax=Photobacterium sp. GJ3 TaxID=2829502 RepID=UPI001B8C30D2|nr:hypothetical protein [Photobacterium sp. GJ3]QUJ69215.1 hypothetical protein KDD30_15280 [Photobacterium sp. GJ3]